MHKSTLLFYVAGITVGAGLGLAISNLAIGMGLGAALGIISATGTANLNRSGRQ